MAGLLVAEGMLSERTIARRKRRVLDKYQPQAVADIKRAFRSEGARVLDIVRAFRLPYVPRETAMTETVQEAQFTRINNTQTNVYYGLSYPARILIPGFPTPFNPTPP
jgi:hypothetical protein